MPTNLPLTERQSEVYRFILDYMREHQAPPTVRDVGNHLGIVSPEGVMCHLRALWRKGYIQFGGGKARGIRVVGECCPYCGKER